MRSLIIILSIILFSGGIVAQNKKEIKEKGIHTKIKYNYDLKGYKEIKIKMYEEKYDSEGNLKEEILYDKEGKQDKHFTYNYDKNNNLITKISYSKTGTIKKTTIYIYKNDLKLSKIVKDSKDRIIEKVSYEYKKK